MNILIFTQKVDSNDPVLGFFVGWLREFSKKFDSVKVICLESGKYVLPQNVTIYTIGKAYGLGKLKYIYGVYKYLFLIRGLYDKVFVHMNQEYVFSLGPYWMVKGIPVYLWRNHVDGGILTSIAVFFSKKVFYTSKKSFTANFKKSVMMPVGTDTILFKHIPGAVRKKYSVCMIGRISPIKNIDLALEAFNILVARGVQASLNIIGDVPVANKGYYESLKEYVAKNNLSKTIYFMPGVSQDKLPEIYNSYEVCLNLTEEGSFDKTIVEASACGTVPIVQGDSFNQYLPEVCITTKSAQQVSHSIEVLLHPEERIRIQKNLIEFVTNNSLQALVSTFMSEIK